MQYFFGSAGYFTLSERESPTKITLPGPEGIRVACKLFAHASGIHFCLRQSFLLVGDVILVEELSSLISLPPPWLPRASFLPPGGNVRISCCGTLQTLHFEVFRFFAVVPQRFAYVVFSSQHGQPSHGSFQCCSPYYAVCDGVALLLAVATCRWSPP